MNAHISAWGRLIADPRTGETANGKPMAFGRLAVSMGTGREGDEPATLWLGIAAFGRCADVLAKHRKGEHVSVAGRLEMRPYTAQDGERRDGWQCVADSIIGARSDRPAGGRKQGSGTGAAQHRAAPAEPNDSLPW